MHNGKPSVLIVDDNLKNLQVLGNLLNHNGYTAVAAQNGQQALDYVKKEKPAIILLDIRMPELDGFEVCRQLKDSASTKDIPVLFITALNEMEDKAKAFAVGGADYIIKPFVSEEVLARVKVHLLNSLLFSQLTETNRYLKELNEIKNKFIGIAAHDIRSPLGAANGILEVVLNGELGPLTEQQKEFLQLVFNSGNQILDLVSDLLDVSVIESGNLKLKKESASLKKIIENQVQLYQLVCKKKKIKILTKLADLPQIHIDSEKIGQVLGNLISNAAKFSPQSSKIRITLVSEDRYQIFSVLDQGPGISEADQQNLFTIYRKLTALPTGGEKSSGLGLAICKKIVDAHQGIIFVQSELGEGSAFIVKLPMDATDVS